MLNSQKLLRLALLADGVACLGLGGALALGAGALATPLGLPAGLLQPVGLFLLAWAAFVLWTGAQMPPPRRAAWVIVIGNLLWVADSVALLAFVPATGLGVAFVLGQAGLGLAAALVQMAALRRGGGAVAA